MMYTVKIYLNEVGWDGEPYFAYFETEELANEAMRLLDEKWHELEQEIRDVYALDLSVEHAAIVAILLSAGDVWVPVTILPSASSPVFDPMTWAEDMYKELWQEVDAHEGFSPVAT